MMGCKLLYFLLSGGGEKTRESLGLPILEKSEKAEFLIPGVTFKQFCEGFMLLLKVSTFNFPFKTKMNRGLIQVCVYFSRRLRRPQVFRARRVRALDRHMPVRHRLEGCQL